MTSFDFAVLITSTWLNQCVQYLRLTSGPKRKNELFTRSWTLKKEIKNVKNVENVNSLDLKFSLWIWSLHFTNFVLAYKIATPLYNANFYWLHPNSLIWFTQVFPLQLISWLLETPFQKFVTFLLLSKLYLPTSMFLLMCLQ